MRCGVSEFESTVSIMHKGMMNVKYTWLSCGFHMDFTWFPYAEGEVEACDWLGGERCVTGREKSAGSL